MTWENFYLLCFLIGLGMSAVSLLLGSVHIHLPYIHLHGGFMHGGAPHAVPGVHVHAQVPHAHVSVPVGADENLDIRGGYAVSPLNFSTLMAFLAWFGGAGYLLTHYSSVVGMLALLFSILAGLSGGAIVFWFMAKVLYSPDEDMDPADYDMVGALGRLTVGIRRAGGTGEIVYVQGGASKTAAARSESGEAIEKGSEVVVTKYEKGIAYVRRWEELTGEGTDSTAAASGGADQN